jgi:hypothetical protein
MRACLIVTLCVLCATAAQAEMVRDSSGVRPGVTVVRWEAPGGDSDTALLVQLTVVRASKCDRGARGLWGTDLGFGPPETRVQDLLIVYGGDSLNVPVSAFVDLSNPSSIKINGDYSCKFVVRGGDTSTSYSAVFTVEGACLVKRHVALEEFPESWEETTYACPSWHDE